MVAKKPPTKILSVNFYQSDKGAEPVREWLQSLTKDQKKIIGEDIKTVQRGWPIGMPFVRKLDKGLWEVRSHFNDGIARVIFTIVNRTMVLLHGFVKKSQKTPAKDLTLAKDRMAKLK